jgi:hypothetical protein
MCGLDGHHHGLSRIAEKNSKQAKSLIYNNNIKKKRDLLSYYYDL